MGDVADFTISRGTRGDIDDIVASATRFYESTDQHGRLTINKGNYRATLEEFIDNPYVCSLLARAASGELLGYMHIYCQNDYTVEMVGEMFQMYVEPAGRGKGVSRALVEAALEQYKKWGCVRLYAEGAAGIEDGGVNDKLFENLWTRYGYKKQGIVMMKECA